MSRSPILNANGHHFDEEEQVVLMPTAIAVTSSPRPNKPRIKVTPGMRMRQFYKVKEDGSIEAYTPKGNNKNPAASDAFHLGIYRSPTAALLPKDARDDV